MPTSIPKDPEWDATLSLLREGYCFLSNRMRDNKTDRFESRLFLEPVFCIRGIEGAALLYDESHFKRVNALPRHVKTTLTGDKGVQTLDGLAHRHRKSMFTACFTPERRNSFQLMLRAHLLTAADEWHRKDMVCLFDEMQLLLFRAACAWVGIPLSPADAQQYAQHMGAMIDGFGGVFWRHWRGRYSRWRAESWMEMLVQRVRAGSVTLDPELPLAIISQHRDDQGELLPPHVAAVEILNLVRPITAIATYSVFCAMALHEHPSWRARLKDCPDTMLEYFAQEVRRYYPFTPFIGARARHAFEWEGYVFAKDQLALLDIYGMLHDAQLWGDPERFRPERFQDDTLRTHPYIFIPQGGGEYATGHRCAGEWLTVESLKAILRFLTDTLTYHVPAQLLEYSLSRIPTLPKSRFLLHAVKA